MHVLHLSELLEEVNKRSKTSQSKYEYCKTLTFLSESLKKLSSQSLEDVHFKTSVLDHFKVYHLKILNSPYVEVMNSLIICPCFRQIGWRKASNLY